MLHKKYSAFNMNNGRVLDQQNDLSRDSLPIEELELLITSDKFEFSDGIPLEDGNVINQPNGLHGITLLHQAAYSNDFVHTISILESGPVIDVIDKYGNTPLHIAAVRGNWLIFNELIRSGANASAFNNQRNSILHMAIIGGDKRIIECVLSEMSHNIHNDVCMKNTKNYSPLDLAIIAGADKETLMKLLKNVKHKANENNALSLAIKAKNIYLVNLLIRNGCNIYIKNSEGETALQTAIKYNAYSIAKLLINLNKSFNKFKDPINFHQSFDDDVSSKFYSTITQVDFKYPYSIFDKFIPNYGTDVSHNLYGRFEHTHNEVQDIGPNELDPYINQLLNRPSQIKNYKACNIIFLLATVTTHIIKYVKLDEIDFIHLSLCVIKLFSNTFISYDETNTNLSLSKYSLQTILCSINFLYCFKHDDKLLTTFIGIDLLINSYGIVKAYRQHINDEKMYAKLDKEFNDLNLLI